MTVQDTTTRTTVKYGILDYTIISSNKAILSILERNVTASMSWLERLVTTTKGLLNSFQRGSPLFLGMVNMYVKLFLYYRVPLVTHANVPVLTRYNFFNFSIGK